MGNRTNLLWLMRGISFLALGMFCILLWWANTRDLELSIAWGGWSPVDWVNQILFPENFARNFANGIGAYEKSAFMHVYPLAYRYFGISPEQLLPIVIALEIGATAWAAYYLCRTVFPGAPVAVPLLFAALTVGSYAQGMELARFGHPYVGLYYNAANVFRILAVALFLRRQHLAAAVLLAGSFVTHPALGVIGLAFIAAAALAAPRVSTRSALLSAIIFALFAGAWLAIGFRNASISGGDIPLKDWVEISRAFSFHWYPWDYGLFTTEHQERFVPFVSFGILYVYYLTRRPLGEIDKRLLMAIVAMLGLVIAGILFSVFPVAPALIKLSLHRASDMVILVGMLYVVRGLWGEIQSGRAWRVGVGLGVLVSPFLFRPGFPLAWSIMLVLPLCVSLLRNKHADTGDLVVALLVGVTAILMVVYAVLQLTGNWQAPAYIGTRLFFWAILLGAMAAVFTQRYRNFSYAIVSVTIAITAARWAMTQGADSETKIFAPDYKTAQIWARDNTRPDSIFMTDPTIYYGWRDFSQRSSFGNLREWLFTSWLYDSRREVYEEGMRRFKEFGIELDAYLHDRPPLDGYARLSRRVGSFYNNVDDEWRLSLAKRYGIDYFVFVKRNLVSRTRLPVVYENEKFMIVAAKTP